MNFKLLHLCDSLFPIGGFGYSDGLEAAVTVRLKPDTTEFAAADSVANTRTRVASMRNGRTAALSGRSDDDSVALLGSWLDVSLDETLGRAEGPAVWRAWQAFRDGDVDAMIAIDEEIVAIRPAAATRRATRAMGQRLLTTWQALYPDPRVDAILRRAASIRGEGGADERREGGAAGRRGGGGADGRRGDDASDARALLSAPSLPVAFAIACASGGVGRREAVEAFVYTRLASTVSAAMRLMPIGQAGTHALLARTLERAAVVVDAIARGRDTIACFAPAMDVAAMSQQYLHSRLFRS